MFSDKDTEALKNEKIPPQLLKKIRRIEIRSRALVNEAVSGGYQSLFRGYGMEFQEVREYFPGDDYRSIDWNVTARHSAPYVKRFREERQMNVMLLIDSSGSLDYGSTAATKSEKLAEIAAVLAFTAISNQDKIGAIFFTDAVERVIIPSKNKNTILRLIREILFLKTKNRGTNMNQAIDFAIETMKRRGIIFILSDFICEVEMKKIFIAAKKHDIIPVVLQDPFEEASVNVGLVDMVDNESGRMLLVDTSSSGYRRSIDRRKKQKEKLFREFAKYQIEPLVLSTAGDTEKAMIQYFEKRIKKIRI